MGDYNVYNNVHTITYTSNLASYQHRMTYSTNGTTWIDQTLSGSFNVNDTSWLETTSQDYVYMTHSTATHLYRAQKGVSFSSTSLSTVWDRDTNKNRFMAHPEDSAILRFITSLTAGRLFVTDDRFATNTYRGLVNMDSLLMLLRRCPLYRTQLLYF